MSLQLVVKRCVFVYLIILQYGGIVAPTDQKLNQILTEVLVRLSKRIKKCLGAMARATEIELESKS